MSGAHSAAGTCVQLLEGLVGEERDPRVRDDAHDGGGEAAVERPDSLLLGDPHKDVHDVAVPVPRQIGVTVVRGIIQRLRALLRVGGSWDLHFSGRDGHPGSHHVQRIGEHRGGGAGQRARQEALERRQSSEKRTKATQQPPRPR